MEKYKLKKAVEMVAYRYDSELVFSYATVLNAKRKVYFAETTDENDPNAKQNSEINVEPNKNTVSNSTEQAPGELGIRLLKTFIEAANYSATVLTDRGNNLSYLKTMSFAKLKEQFNIDISEEQMKTFVFWFFGKQIDPEFYGVDLSKIIDKNMLHIKELESNKVESQLEFRLVCNNLDLEAFLMKETVVKAEQKENTFATLVRMLDDTGKLWNGIATIVKYDQTTALTIKNTKGETKVYWTLDENLIIQDFILDKVKNHTGIEFIEKGDKPENNTTSLVFFQTVAEVNGLLEAIVTHTVQEQIANDSGNRGKSAPQKKTQLEELQDIFEDKGFEVRQYGNFRLKYDILVKFSSNLDLQFYKPSVELHHGFQSSVPLREIAEIRPKRAGSHKLVITFKNPKKYNKTKLMFKNFEEGQRFIGYFCRLLEMAENSKSAVLMENSRKEPTRQYSWISGDSARAKISHLNGRIASHTFHVINLSENESKMSLEINFVKQTLILKDANGKLHKMIDASKVKNFETELGETQVESILFEGNHRIKLLFMDNKERYIFRSAIGSLKAPNKFFSKGNILEEYKLFITTFNAGYAEPPDLTLWLEKALECDIVVIGMQETKTGTWFEKIQQYLGQVDLQLITVNIMWKMSIFVFVKGRLQEYVSNVAISSKPTGIANIIGNKGGVGIGMKIKETSFCFISSHLAARPGRVTLRKANFYDILKNVRPCSNKFEPTAAFDYFFFIGDTNFRIDYPFDKTLEAIEKGDIQSLKQYDELAKEREQNNEFTCFDEPDINFKPTYRRIRNEPLYSNKNNQSPSWTDRVLSKAKPGRKLEVIEYNSSEFFYCSDHRPVYSIIKINVEPHYTFFPPLHTRPNVPLGQIVFSKLMLNYDFERTSELGEFAPEYVLPMKVHIAFYGKFLNNYPNTTPMDFSDLLIWKGEKIPMIQCVVADVNYLKSQFLDFVVYVKSEAKEDMLIGQAALSLSFVEFWNYDKQFQFSVPVHFYGKNYGHISGELSFKPFE